MKRKIVYWFLIGLPLILIAGPTAGHSPAVQQTPDEICTKYYGNYEMKNLFIQNPVLPDSSFCITRPPEVNGEATTRAINNSVIEIRFDELNLKLGDPLIISVYHSPGCSPKLINPEVIDPRN